MAKKLEDIKLRSEQVEDILSHIPYWMIRYGNILFLVLIIMLLIISWFIKYPDVINTEVLLTTETPPQKEYANTTGKISTLLTTERKNVEANTPLAIIENTANYEHVYILKTIIDSLQVNDKTFSFPIHELPILTLGEISASYALFKNSYTQYQLNNTLKPFSNETLANALTLSELKRRLNNAKQQLSINLAELQLKEKNFERYKTLFNKGIIAELEYEQQEIEYKSAKRNYVSLKNTISQINEAISNAKKVSRGTEINKTTTKIVSLNSVIQAFNQLKNSIKTWETKYVLKSNINGTVYFADYWKPNTTIYQGDLAFIITPTINASYIAKLKTPATNSGKLKEGQCVNIKLANYPDTEFGVLQGKITSISLVADKDGFYRVIAKLPNKLITSYNKDITFKQEMAGSGEIITEDLRLLERFFYQFKTLFSRQ